VPIRWPPDWGARQNGLIPFGLEPQAKQTIKASTTILAGKRKAKLKAKHRRQRAGDRLAY
jgi:hypothetical protein